jgi:hypothetical protein
MANVATEQTIVWPGKSGTQYKYWICAIGSKMKVEPGNYIFVRETKPSTFAPLYAGETGDLDDRLSNPSTHHKFRCVTNHGATHLCVHTTSGGLAVRQAEEADLIARWQPPCND